MRIAIDLLIAEKEPGGMLFSTRALLDGLASIDQKNDYYIITARPKEYKALAQIPTMHIYAVKLISWRGILIQHQMMLPEILRKIRPDVLHVPAFAAPIGWHGPLVITVHDLAFKSVPEQSSLYSRFYWNYLLRESVHRAQRIITISEQTKHELTSFWDVKEEDITIIHNALRLSLTQNSLTSAQQQKLHKTYGPRYLLHVGRIMPRKNIEKLVEAFDLLAGELTDLHLVLTGGAGYGSHDVLQQIEHSPYHERIHQVGWVSDEELSALYAMANVVVFPSKHEGFGLPLLEAMALGTPVVASYEAASQEIAGDAVVRTDCTQASTLAASIREVLSDSALHQQLVAAGKLHVQAFTSEAAARATVQEYEAAIKTKVLR